MALRGGRLCCGRFGNAVKTRGGGYWPCPRSLRSKCFTSNFVDMIRRRSLRTRAIKMLVLDEADEMLNKGRNHKRVHFMSPKNS